MSRNALATLLLVAACSKSGSMDVARASALFTEVPVDTAPGLSGLAVDETGAIWTVAERDAKAYRITLDAALHPKTETFAVQGIPSATDLEGFAWLGNNKVAFGTEGREEGVATVLLGELHASSIVVTGAYILPAETVGITLTKNAGVEGICGSGDTVIAGIESAGERDGKRWAPIVRIAAGKILRTYRLWLTTTTGKLSGLDCRIAADGTIAVLAIERHFEVTKILTFTLADAEDVTPTEALDLGPVLNGTLNLEGIGWMKDGRMVAVVDNQWRTITGPSELLVFKASTK